MKKEYSSVAKTAVLSVLLKAVLKDCLMAAKMATVKAAKTEN